MQFSDIPGLLAVKSHLIKAIKNDRIAHAQLFSGKEGALTLPLALAFNTYLHCQDRQEKDACGVCDACQKNKKYIHPDTYFFFPLSNVQNDNNEERLKANSLKLWRSFLLEQPFGKVSDWIAHYGGENKHALIARDQGRDIVKVLALKPFISTYKVVIIWQPEYMHPAAANGILKILEEPPLNTVFLLASNAAERLIPTIQSRVQAIQTPLLSDDTIKSCLQQKTGIDESRIKAILQLANGDLHAALQLVDDKTDVDQHQFTHWMRACFKKDYKTLVEKAEEFHKFDKLKQQNLLHYSLSMIREALLCLASATTISRTEGEQAKFVQAFSSVLDTSKIEILHTIFSNASHQLTQNGSAKMIFLTLSLRCSAILSQMPS